MLRVLLASILALCAIASAYVFGAASASSIAIELANRARASDSEAVRTRLLDQAESAISDNWAKPAQWHAGAAEILSGVLFARAAIAADADLYGASRDWAVHAVTLAPVQPHAWIRLAALGEQGHSQDLCEPAQCLENSWRVAPVLAGDGACARLQLAHRLSPLDPSDVRVISYIRTERSRRLAARCLSFFSPSELFTAMLAASADAR